MKTPIIAVVRCANANYTALRVDAFLKAPDVLAFSLRGTLHQEPTFTDPDACAQSAAAWYDCTLVYDDELTQRTRALVPASADFALYVPK